MKIKTIFHEFFQIKSDQSNENPQNFNGQFSNKLQLSSPDLDTPIDSRNSIPCSNTKNSCANLIKLVRCTKCFDFNVKVLVACINNRRIWSVLRKSCCNCFGTRSMSSKTCELLQNTVMRNRN